MCCSAWISGQSEEYVARNYFLGIGLWNFWELENGSIPCRDVGFLDKVAGALAGNPEWVLEIPIVTSSRHIKANDSIHKTPYPALAVGMAAYSRVA